MAFTPGSPVHPAYGAGHATVAGACVTVLKAFFQTFVQDKKTKAVTLIPLTCPVRDPSNPKCLIEREKGAPYGKVIPFRTYITGVRSGPGDNRKEMSFPGLTIEGELNKLAMNVAMGRSMGGVHWRTDNTRSLILGEALAAQILADITCDSPAEEPAFVFRTFSRKENGEPKIVKIMDGKIRVDGKLPMSASAL
jgi:hypothetical protein